MLKLLFELRKYYFVITIDNHKILYWDNKHGKIWGTSLQYLPPDPNTIKKVIMSRNRIPAYFIDLLKPSEEDLVEFEKAKSDEELMELVIRDAKKHSCNLIEVKKE